MTKNLFYQEPDEDRWLPFDRHPRRLVRRLVRGAPRVGGQAMVFRNLAKGLDLLGVPYRVNDFRYARQHPQELVCIVGKPHVLFDHSWNNPVLFGASVFSHPLDCPDLFERYPVRRMLVPGEWMRAMCEPWYGDKVRAWPVGIDTDEWAPSAVGKTVDILLYDKVHWQRDRRSEELIGPVQRALETRGRSVISLRYGAYTPEQLKSALQKVHAAVVLSEHETQGIAYQQMLSAGVPVFAWDPGGEWPDPSYHPHRVRFGPVTSVPYWDERCGERFADANDFAAGFDAFWDGVVAGRYAPREYVLENLTLERCARLYLDHADEVMSMMRAQVYL